MEFFNKKIALLEKTVVNKNIPIHKETTNQTQQKPIAGSVNIKPKASEEDDIANKLLTQSVASDIEEIKSNSNGFIPKRVNKSIPLPITKSSADYKKVKEEIISNIEDGICELEYFNIDHTKEYVESALYYLKNIILKK